MPDIIYELGCLGHFTFMTKMHWKIQNISIFMYLRKWRMNYPNAYKNAYLTLFCCAPKNGVIDKTIRLIQPYNEWYGVIYNMEHILNFAVDVVRHNLLQIGVKCPNLSWWYFGSIWIILVGAKIRAVQQRSHFHPSKMAIGMVIYQILI